MRKYHSANLDLIRTSAILMVVLYHCIQWIAPSMGLVKLYYPVGAFGVDLFFALSGYLVGGIYWRENLDQGRVNSVRFILRRVLRTMPPYFVFLAISYFGVLVARGEAFEWRYLFFMQNYMEAMPFFLVSWSLCVEEHFYFALPGVLWLLLKVRHFAIPLALLALALLPTFFRAIAVTPESMAFGFSTTATHLRFDGLMFGVLFAYLRSTRFSDFRAGKGLQYGSLVVVIVMLLLQPFIPSMMMYVFGYLAIAVGFALLIFVWDAASSFPVADGSLNRAIAKRSYSIYLSHSIAIHVAMMLAARISMTSDIAVLSLMLLAIAFAGWTFYLVVERPSIALRNRFAA